MSDSDQPEDATHQQLTDKKLEITKEALPDSVVPQEITPHEADISASQVPISDNTHSPVVVKKPKKYWSKTLIVITVAILLNLGLASGGVYLNLQANKPKPVQHVSKIATTSSNPVAVEQTSAPVKTEATKLHYTAEALKAEFDYPSDWHIASNATDQQITIESPAIQLRDIKGQIGDAKIVIDISPKYSESNYNSVSKDDRVVSSSEKLVYDNPTTVQRKETNLTYTKAASDNDPNSVSAAFISGNLVYQKGSLVGSQNFAPVNPFIVIYVHNCLRGCQFFSTASLTYSDFQSNPLLAKAKDIVKSLRLN